MYKRLAAALAAQTGSGEQLERGEAAYYVGGGRVPTARDAAEHERVPADEGTNARLCILHDRDPFLSIKADANDGLVAVRGMADYTEQT